MSHILLLHSALGLRPSVLRFAEELRSAGHDVTTPDYYDGRVFDSEREGIAYRDEVGAGTLFKKRLLPQLAALPDDTVLAGFSLGAAFAQNLSLKRPAARAVLLMHSVAAPRGDWSGQPVQVHRYAQDPWIDLADVTALSSAVVASGAAFEDWVTPGRGHLFTDTDGPDGDEQATAATLERIGDFVR
ncbi:dienelactone hydrolase family protein [Leekyejoonella antrihumi]|uniref:Dienelactone hydrolase family protein n=1 Tax=Leekyejoonella antrihumi TaxID=1660198 RepID=A0A563E1J2_9MICO|nr:dienelactone hydrolase family protein [Leekyejoonella antrihumi]TWP36071.1 dienelactone hydrolase family protein [Leekyejoonella antrihumi]